MGPKPTISFVNVVVVVEGGRNVDQIFSRVTKMRLKSHTMFVKIFTTNISSMFVKIFTM